jgi:hypothetical protein
MAGQHLAGFGGYDPAGASVEQRMPDLLFELDRTARTIATTTIHLPEAFGSAVEASLAGATQ